MITPAGRKGGERVEIELHPAQRGTEVVFERSQLWKIGTLRPQTLRLQCECVKCDTSFDVDLSGDFAARASVRRYCGISHPGSTPSFDMFDSASWSWQLGVFLLFGINW